MQFVGSFQTKNVSKKGMLNYEIKKLTEFQTKNVSEWGMLDYMLCFFASKLSFIKKMFEEIRMLSLM